MPAEIKDLVSAWLSVLLDFLKFFDNEKLDEVIAKIEEKLAAADAE